MKILKWLGKLMGSGVDFSNEDPVFRPTARDLKVAAAKKPADEKQGGFTLGDAASVRQMRGKDALASHELALRHKRISDMIESACFSETTPQFGKSPDKADNPGNR